MARVHGVLRSSIDSRGPDLETARAVISTLKIIGQRIELTRMIDAEIDVAIE